jgi:hypothetical protein
MFKSVLCVIVLASGVLSQGPGSHFTDSRDSWNIDVIDTGISSTDPCIRVDTQGYPHVAYIRVNATQDSSIAYAFFNGFCWEHSTVASDQDFRECFLALDGAEPRIAFRTGSVPFTLNLATPGSGGSWLIEEFYSYFYLGKLYGLEIDSSGNPHVMYYKEHPMSEKDLHHIYYNGSTWVDEGIWWFGDGSFCKGVSLTLSSSDIPHFSQYNVFTGWMGNQDPYIRVYHTTYTGSGWTGTNLGDSDGDDTDIALDSNDYPRVIYQSGSDLRIQTYDGYSWEMAQVDPYHQSGQYCALAVDGSDVNHVAYRDDIGNNLRYAWGTGSTWNSMLIDSSYAVGAKPDIALDSAGNPFIVYNDHINLQLLLAWYGDPTGFGGHSPGSPDHLAITGISPNPAMDMFSLRVVSDSGLPVVMSLYDISGRKVMETLPGPFTAGISELDADVSDLEPGVYTVHVSDGSRMDAAQVTVIR